MGDADGSTGPLEKTRALFVSPHLDDVALSCGGLVVREAASGGAPWVVTVFAGAPDPVVHRLSQPARDFHAEIHLPDAAAARVVEIRRAEDAAAMATLGARYLWLDHHDAAYRNEAYPSFDAMFAGPVNPADRGLLRQLTDAVLALWRRTAGAELYLPLAIGHHVDHRLCFAMGAALGHAGATVWYYEDFPYAAAAPDAVRRRLAELGVALEPRTVDVTDSMDRRIAAIGCYPTQLGMLFHGRSIAEEVRAFASGTSPVPGRWAERYWG